MLAGAVAVFVGLWAFFTKTLTGRAVLATSNNRLAAQLVGINTNWVMTLSFALSAAIGALAGVLVTPITNISYDVGIALALKGFAAAMLGGMGKPIGALVGGILLGLIEALTAGYISLGLQGRRRLRRDPGRPLRDAAGHLRPQVDGPGVTMTTKRVTLLILAIIVIASPLFFPSNYYYRVGSLIFVNGLAVTGMVILIGYAGQISLGHAGFAGIGGYACALAPVHLGLHPGLAAILGAAISGRGSPGLVGRPVLRLKGYYLAVATLGLGILVSMVLANEAWLTRGPDGIEVPDLGLNDLLEAIGLDLSNSQFWYFFSGLVLVIGAWIALNLYDSPTGRALRALHGSEIAARTVGIDVARLKLQAFVISAVYASLSGSLLALQNKFITPDVAGFMHSIEMVTMAVLGGVGSVLGAFFGAAILTTLPQVLTVFQEYEQILLGLVMMLCMIFMRDGLLPSILRALRGKDK